jgi:hypothetical protein
MDHQAGWDDEKKFLAKKVANVAFMGDWRYGFPQMYLNSVDLDCMNDKYKKYDLKDEFLTDEALDIMKMIEDDTTKRNPFIVILNIGISCSDKLNTVLSLVFDNVFTFSGLIKAIKNERSIKRFVDIIDCLLSTACRPSRFPSIGLQQCD